MCVVRGDEIRFVRFRQTLRGYRIDQTDALLARAAEEVDGGRSPKPVIMEARLQKTLRGYHPGEVDQYLAEILAFEEAYDERRSPQPRQTPTSAFGRRALKDGIADGPNDRFRRHHLSRKRGVTSWEFLDDENRQVATQRNNRLDTEWGHYVFKALSLGLEDTQTKTRLISRDRPRSDEWFRFSNGSRFWCEWAFQHGKDRTALRLVSEAGQVFLIARWLEPDVAVESRSRWRPDWSLLCEVVVLRSPDNPLQPLVLASWAGRYLDAMSPKEIKGGG
jgi:DivIVA domain-containing protein